MARQLEERITATERTDELSASSADAIRRFERAPAAARPAADTDSLDRSLEALRDALDAAEDRWRQLESRIEAQDRAIGDLQSARADLNQNQLDQTHAGTTVVPELTEIVLLETLVAKPDEPAAQLQVAQSLSGNAPAAPQALLERVAWLEAYIAGRKDYWQTMESEISAKSLRIAELELEQEQRIARERNLAERQHEQSNRSEELRDEVQRLRFRLDELRGADQ
jgi:hypothetical protein